MRKIIIWYNLRENYSRSQGVLTHIKGLIQNQKYFEKQKFILLSPLDFIFDIKFKKKLIEKNQKISDEKIELVLKEAFKYFISILNEYKKFDGCILIGFHSIGFKPFFKTKYYNIIKTKKCKILIYLDDLHSTKSLHKERKIFNEKYPDYKCFKYHQNKNYYFDKTDAIISPGFVYFQNMNIKYVSKTYLLKFVFNELFYEQFNINNFNNRKNLILLSGDIHPFSDTRTKLYKTWNNDSNNLHNIIKFIENKKGQNKYTGVNYFRKICKYKGAFVGFYDKPIDYVVAKIIEIMACGSILFVDEKPELEKYGIKKFVHYVPILFDNKKNIIDDDKYYLEYLTTEKGINIKENALQLINNNFLTKHYCQNLLDIIKTLD